MPDPTTARRARVGSSRSTPAPSIAPPDDAGVDLGEPRAARRDDPLASGAEAVRRDDLCRAVPCRAVADHDDVYLVAGLEAELLTHLLGDGALALRVIRMR